MEITLTLKFKVRAFYFVGRRHRLKVVVTVSLSDTQNTDIPERRHSALGNMCSTIIKNALIAVNQVLHLTYTSMKLLIS